MRKDWIRLPMTIVQNKKLQPIDAIISAILFDLAEYNENEKITSARCTREYLSETASISLRAVSDSLKRLSSEKIIEIIRTGKSSYYILQEGVLKPKKQQAKQKQEQEEKKGPLPMILENYNLTDTEYAKLAKEFDENYEL